jgi:hypothetical protein
LAPRKPSIAKTKKELEAIAERKAEIIAKRKEIIEGLPHLHRFKWYQWAHDFFHSHNRMTLLCAANQISKDLAVDTEIPTPNGFKRMGELQIGDIVFAQTGEQTKIVDVPYRGKGPGYKVIFTDGVEIIAGPNHEWVCKSYDERFRKKFKSSNGRVFDNPTYGNWQILTTEQIIDAGAYAPLAKNAGRRVVVPVSGCADYSTEKVLPVDPYILGLLLGDGCFRGKGYTITNPESELVEPFLDLGAKPNEGRLSYRLPVNLRNAIRGLGLGECLSASKFIPEEYLRTSTDDRLALLRGLMDTDGTCVSPGRAASYSTSSPRLAADVRALVCSLGGTVRTKRRSAGYRAKSGDFVKCRDTYNLSLKTPFNPFKLRRKAAKWGEVTRYKHERVIYSIEPVGEIESCCITVDHSSGTFLATTDYVVTHNSSTQIRKCIEWAGNPALWPTLWKEPPRQMWYLYPTKEIYKGEFVNKWEPEFMPRGKYKTEHPTYGWKLIKDAGEIIGIRFNSGMNVYFRTYSQNVHNLQAGSCAAIFCDEELQEELYDELMLRLAATKGYFSMVFTATRNQNFWRLAIEGQGEQEKFPDAWKRQVTMYDCMHYMDGSPGHFSLEDIQGIVNSCRSETEVQRRVLGRFVTEQGRKYPQYDALKHNVKPFAIPRDWKLYSAVDVGSGGAGHPPAIVFVAVKPDYRYGVVYRGWIGNDGRNYTAGDIYKKYLDLKGAEPVIEQRYDQGSRDFRTISDRAGDTFLGSDKRHDRGEDVVNTLFKAGMLQIFIDPDLEYLGTELTSLMLDTPKNKAKDDFCDALRYCVVTIPWDWTCLKGEKSDIDKELEKYRPYTDVERVKMEIDERRGEFSDKPHRDNEWNDLDSEFEEWNARYIV